MEDALELNWIFGEKTMSWKVDDQCRTLQTHFPIRDVTALSDGSGFLLVQSLQNISLATIFNSDATERANIEMPKDFRRDEIFYYSEYVRKNLHLIVAGSGRDFGYYVNEIDGTLSEPHEVR